MRPPTNEAAVSTYLTASSLTQKDRSVSFKKKIKTLGKWAYALLSMHHVLVRATEERSHDSS